MSHQLPELPAPRTAISLCDEFGSAVKAFTAEDMRAYAEEAIASSQYNLLRAISDIRQKTGVGDKPMLSELADAVASVKRELQWLPIESAPKDGTKLLLYFPRIGWVCGSWDDDEYAKRPRPYWTCDRERGLGKIWIRGTQPTHWMPLPPRPADMQNSKEDEHE